MNLRITLFVLLFISYLGYGQQPVKGKVVDENNI